MKVEIRFVKRREPDQFVDAEMAQVPRLNDHVSSVVLHGIVTDVTWALRPEPDMPDVHIVAFRER